MERIRGTNAAQILVEWRMKNGPMPAGIGGEKNGSSAANDPANFVERSRTGGQVNEYIADLTRPGGPAITGEFDHAGAARAPQGFFVWSCNQIYSGATRE